MPVRLITAASSEPLTRLQVKKHLRLVVEDDDEFTSQDDMIDDLIITARQMAEENMNRVVKAQTLEWVGWLDYFDEPLTFPDVEDTPIHPIRQIVSVKYFDSSDVEQTLDSSNYSFADYVGNASLEFVTAANSLSISSTKTYPVTVRMNVGYATVDDIPKPILRAMLLMIGYWYENTQDTVRKMPTASEHLLMPYRIITFA